MIESEPLVELSNLRRPDEPAVVTVACGDQPARLRDATHLAECAQRIDEVLQHLVRVHDVVPVVRYVEQVVHVADHEVDVVDTALRDFVAGECQRVLSVLQRGHAPRCDQCGEVGGDRARPASDIENRVPGVQPR